jgi:uncharacterized metal-binding protein
MIHVEVRSPRALVICQWLVSELQLGNEVQVDLERRRVAFATKAAAAQVRSAARVRWAELEQQPASADGVVRERACASLVRAVTLGAAL